MKQLSILFALAAVAAHAQVTEVRLGQTQDFPSQFTTQVVDSRRLGSSPVVGLRLQADAPISLQRVLIRLQDGRSLDFSDVGPQRLPNPYLNAGDSTSLTITPAALIAEIDITAASRVGTSRLSISGLVFDQNPLPGPQPGPGPLPPPPPPNGDDSRYLECRYNGANNQPYSDLSNIFIGKPGFGFQDAGLCDTTVRASRWGVVCNWTGNGYSPYKIRENATAGKPDFGFTDLNACTQAIADSDGDLLCNWSGVGFSPYYVRGTGNVGKPDYGITDYAGCVGLVRGRHNDFMCNWNGNNFQPYNVTRNTPIGNLDYGYSDLGSCQTAVADSSYGRICNWTGSGFGVYDVNNPVTPQRVYTAYSDCAQSLR